MKNLAFVLLIPLFVCTFVTSCRQDDKEEEIPEIDYVALEKSLEEVAIIAVNEIPTSVERTKKKGDKSVFASAEAFANTKLSQALGEMEGKNPNDYPEYQNLNINNLPNMKILSAFGNSEFKKFAIDLQTRYTYNEVHSLVNSYSTRAANAIVTGQINYIERNNLTVLYYSAAAFCKRFHTPEFRAYLNTFARNKACCDWKEIWRNGVEGLVFGAVTGAAYGGGGGTVILPGVGTVSGALGVGIVVGAYGFVSSAGGELLHQLIWP